MADADNFQIDKTIRSLKEATSGNTSSLKSVKDRLLD